MILFLVLLFLCFNLPPNTSATSSSAQISEFLVSVIEKFYKNCDILISVDGDADPTDFHQLFLQNLRFKLPTTSIYLLNLNSRTELIRQSSIHQLGDQCFLSVSELLHLDVPKGLQLFSKLITWRHGAITWKDVDHYVFITQKSHMDSVALSPVTLKIKFKIILGVSTNPDESWDRSIKAACFYCNNGQPTVVTTKLIPGRPIKQYELFPDYVNNFYGFKIRAAVSSKIMYRIEIYEKDGKWYGKPGVHTRMIELCQRKLNFTYELFPSIGGGGSGVKWPNGTWTGSMADILYDNAEFGMVTAQTLDRNELVSFSFPVTYDWLTFATGEARVVHTWRKIFWPLDAIVWYCVAPTLITVIVAWYFIAKFAHGVERRSYDFGSSAWYMISPLLEQCFRYPSSQGLRCFCIAWLFFSMNISTAYRSQLVPSLAFPLTQTPPQTFEELTDSSYAWGLYYLAGAAYSAFRSSTNPTYVKIFQGMEIENDAVHCLIRAIETRFACIIYEGSAVDVVHRSLSDKHGRHPIHVAPATTFFISSCWVMEKRAIFRPNFERIMHRTMDMGVNMRWVEMNYRRIREERWNIVNQTRYTFSEAKDGPGPLELMTFRGPFFVLVTGALTAALSFALEITTFKLLPTVMRSMRKILLGLSGQALHAQYHNHGHTGTAKDFSDNYPPAFGTLYGLHRASEMPLSSFHARDHRDAWGKLKLVLVLPQMPQSSDKL